MILPIVAAILGISLLVLVHELGHFIVAKLKGMKVERFSIGMGPKVIGFKRGETEYRLSWFLFGGYVKFFGDELEEGKDPKKIPGGFFTTSPWSRILVCFAGGFANILLAWLLYTLIFYVGKPITQNYLDPVIGGVLSDSVASEIGLSPGDRIEAVDGVTVKTWEELVRRISIRANKEVVLVIERNEELFTKRVLIRPDPKTGIGRLGIYPKYPVIVGGVLEDSPAEDVGLMKGDQIIAVNEVDVFGIELLIETIRENESKAIALTILREGKQLNISVVPIRLKGQEFAAIGFVPTTITIYPKPWEQFWHDLSLAGYSMAALLTRRIPVKAMSGPVEIVKIIGVSTLFGWGAFISIVALISLYLGILNLLPIPVLDGGHIIFTLIETIRKRPLSIKTITKIQNVFVVLIIMLFIYITYHNLLRW